MIAHSSPRRVRRGLLRAAMVAGLVAGVAAPLAGSSALAKAGDVTVVAGGLQNPRALALGAGGRVYIAQAGRGGPACLDKKGETCIGFTGLIGRLQAGKVVSPVGGLVSAAGKDGTFAVGADGVSVAPDGTVFIAMAAAPDCRPLPPGVPARGTAQLGRLLTWKPGGRVTALADVGKVECATNPDKADRNSNPYAVLALGPDSAVVVDAGANALFTVKGSEVKLLTVLPKNGKAQSVPTSITKGPGGDYYVGELAEGAGPGKARVLKVTPDGRVSVFATGFSNITGVAFGRDKRLYVTQLAKSLGSPKPSGSVVSVAPDGTRTTLGAGKLAFPAGAVVRGDELFVSNASVLPATTPKKSPFGGLGGQLVKISLAG